MANIETRLRKLERRAPPKTRVRIVGDVVECDTQEEADRRQAEWDAEAAARRDADRAAQASEPGAKRRKFVNLWNFDTLFVVRGETASAFREVANK